MLRILLFLLSSLPFLLFGNAQILEYGYDDEGLVVSVESKDGNTRYTYAYDTLGRVIESVNLKTNETIKRIYDENGNLLEEIFPEGFSLKNRYDDQNRRIATILPDSSSIEYLYSQSHLYKIIRKSPAGEPLYTHTYNVYDAIGHVVEQEMIGNLGKISSLFDEHGRHVQLSTPIGTEEIQEFDNQGNVLKMARFSGVSTFSYDEEGQIIRENNHYFTFEDHGEYDSRGNTIKKNDLLLGYDAHDRLISIEKPRTFRQFYTYDGFHRRLSETLYFWENESWHEKQKRYFLYDHQNEIGALNEKGEIVELRILRDIRNAEIGTAVALELDGKIFAPIHDLTGNLSALISLETQTIKEIYNYHAFGEVLCRHSISPWRFCSKRSDPLTGLVFFGRRFYDPEVRRWLTKDPSHPADGINPYTFAHNNPLLFVDPYGLESIFSQIGYWAGTLIQQYCYHVIPFPGIRYLGIHLGELLGATPISSADYACCSGSVGTFRPEKKHVNVWINGLNTTSQTNIEFAQAISTAFGGEKVYFAYNRTQGFVSDVWEHIANKLHFQTSALEIALETLKEAIKEVGGPNGGGRVTVFAHSQGGAILSHALKFLSIEEHKMLEVYTFGTASFFPKGNLAKIRHYVATRDIIPLIPDPLGYLLAFIWGSSIVQFIPAHDGYIFDNHTFSSKPYQQELLKLGAEQGE